MLLEIAIGGAYGAGFEFVRAERVHQFNDLKTYHSHEFHKIPPGCYTDDTPLSLGIAELLLEEHAWTPLKIADKFLEVFHRDPRKGYASRFYEFLSATHTAEQFLGKIRPASEKSGAAMRAAPIGLLPDMQEVIDKSALQAALTHHTMIGINSSVTVSLSAHFLAYKLGSKNELPCFLHDRIDTQWEYTWSGFVSAKAYDCVSAALTSLLRNHRMSDLLKDCVNFSGDVDTAASIAMALASVSNEYESDIPSVLINTLENRRFGRRYLQEIDAQLCRILFRKERASTSQ
jgi:ADP-ribosylglycohydrolase